MENKDKVKMLKEKQGLLGGNLSSSNTASWPGTVNLDGSITVPDLSQYTYTDSGTAVEMQKWMDQIIDQQKTANNYYQTNLTPITDPLLLERMEKIETSLVTVLNLLKLMFVAQLEREEKEKEKEKESQEE